MGTPSVVSNNPNAAVAVGASPLAALFVYVVAYSGWKFSNEVAAAIGSVGSGVILFFFGGLRKAGGSVWSLGVKGCVKRLWRGIDPPAGPG